MFFFFVLGHKLTFEHYHRVEDQHGYLDYLAETYKDYVTLESIGTSHEGRELKLIKISSGYPNASAIWIDGGNYSNFIVLFNHAREH